MPLKRGMAHTEYDESLYETVTGSFTGVQYRDWAVLYLKSFLGMFLILFLTFAKLWIILTFYGGAVQQIYKSYAITVLVLAVLIAGFVLFKNKEKPVTFLGDGKPYFTFDEEELVHKFNFWGCFGSPTSTTLVKIYAEKHLIGEKETCQLQTFYKGEDHISIGDITECRIEFWNLVFNQVVIHGKPDIYYEYFFSSNFSIVTIGESSYYDFKNCKDLK